MLVLVSDLHLTDGSTARAVNADGAMVERQFSAVLDGIVATEAARALGRAISALADGARPVQVTYVVGNHDRILWNFPGLRARLTAAFPAIDTFVTSLESAEYAVVARHGHEWDDQCHGWQFRDKVLLPGERVGRFAPEAYQVIAIGEVITAELMGGLVHHVRQGGAPPSLVEQVMEVNNLRPILDVFAWLEWLGEGGTEAHQRILFEALRAAVDGVLASRLARQWDRIERDILISADLVDRLQQARAVLLDADFRTFRGRTEAVRKLQGVFNRVFGEEDRLLEGAAAEEAIQPAQAARGIQRVVYGITHWARHVYFSGERNGRARMYVNTGTYLPLISRAADRRSFASSLQMSLLYLYREDEDTDGKLAGTTSLDIWTGIRRKVYG